MISPPLYHPTSTLADAPAVLRGIADLESLNLHADERESLRLIATAIEEASKIADEIITLLRVRKS